MGVGERRRWSEVEVKEYGLHVEKSMEVWERKGEGRRRR